jgi:hypothetical protein
VPETLTKNESTLSLIPTEVREDEASATLDETSATMADARQGNALKAVNTEGP